ncbi:MAG: MFS transporter [Hyphomicrobiaceae bacterium]|nr:MFS transporter [Hyphomicrobiaceae bacterium]
MSVEASQGQSGLPARIWLVIIAGCIISLVGFGARSSFGLFLEPLTTAHGWTRETFALALAIQNLMWGIGVPVAGMIADKYGAWRVLVCGALVYAFGVWGMANSETGAAFHIFAGFTTGLGVALTAFSLALAVIAKAVGPERRSMALGIGAAAGSAGQVVFSPFAQALISAYGWHSALLVLAASVLVIIPAALLLPKGSQATGLAGEADQTFSQAMHEAFSHKGYMLLTTGFFVCGFHVAFITVHFPAYVTDLGLSPQTGAIAISLVGLFNIVGAYASGAVGQRYSKKSSLAVIYFLRAVAITCLLVAPKTQFTIYAFAVAMGLLWLSTVPLTTGIVGQIFGTRFMATLFGIVFFSHQLGSFTGVWLGGWLYDKTGSYDPVWWAGVALGLLAALIHIPIDERPLPRILRSGRSAA